MEQFKIGDLVRVVKDETDPRTFDWDGLYIVVGAQLEYQKTGGINYSVASQDEIDHKLGSTDGFKECHLAPA